MGQQVYQFTIACLGTHPSNQQDYGKDTQEDSPKGIMHKDSDRVESILGAESGRAFWAWFFQRNLIFFGP
jgi:hypothetical protein